MRYDTSEIPRQEWSDPEYRPSTAPRRARLLVVDDDAELLSVAREYGARQLIEITCVSSAREAVEQVARRWFDGALLDVWLAGAESFDLAARLKNVPGNTNLPIAFIAADDGAAVRAAAAQAGGSLFLGKPLTESRLEDAAGQLVALRRANRARILIVDTDAAFLDRARRLFGEQGFSVRTLSRPLEVLSALEASDPDVMIVDVADVGPDGLDVCRIVRTSPGWQDLPVLVVTDHMSELLRVRAFRAGCDDYIAKRASDEELAVRVQVRIERRRILQARLAHDPVTGLLLRRAFLDRLRARLSESRRHGHALSLCLLDLDEFKLVNDSHGHLAGDRVLSALGRLLQTRLRTEDLRARWGGEEFALVFPKQEATAAKRAVEKMLDALRQLEFVDSAGASFRVTFSAGVVEYPTDGVSLEELLRVADERLYAAKAGGRGRVVAR